MKVIRIAWLSTMLLLTLAWGVGCDRESADPSNTATANGEHGHGHEHGNGAHDHPADGHTHAPGPHGGTIADWGGGEYHVEFTVDHDKREATVYLLGDDAKTPRPIVAEKLLLTIKDPELQADLLPVPQEGETGGKSSRFVGAHDALATVKEYAGTISGLVEGTPYAGDFQEEASSPAHGDAP